MSWDGWRECPGRETQGVERWRHGKEDVGWQKYQHGYREGVCVCVNLRQKEKERERERERGWKEEQTRDLQLSTCEGEREGGKEERESKKRAGAEDD